MIWGQFPFLSPKCDKGKLYFQSLSVYLSVLCTLTYIHFLPLLHPFHLNISFFYLFLTGIEAVYIPYLLPPFQDKFSEGLTRVRRILGQIKW